MDYIRFAISNPVKVTVGVLLLLLFGSISLGVIPIQLVPNVDEPVISVETDWRRGSPQEVEEEIIKEQEERLKRVSNLKKMTSVSRQGGGEIILEFYIGTNIDRALQEVSDKLREVPEYPEDADNPVISAADIAANNPIAWMVITSGDDDFNVEGLRYDVEEKIKPYLERIKGVARINIFGGRDREVHIEVNPKQMAQRGITFTQLRDALQRENVNMSAGDLSAGRQDVRVRTVGQYDNVESIKNTIIAYDATGGPVRVRDVTTDVKVTLAKPTRLVRSRGRQAVAINAVRETGSNVIDVMNQLKDRIEAMNDPKDGLLTTLGPQLKIEQVYDETTYIHDSIGLVGDNLRFGGMLAVLVLLLFLRDVRYPIVFFPSLIGLMISVVAFLMTGGIVWSVFVIVFLIAVLICSPSTLIVAIAIPVSVIGTFVAMAAFGRSVNVISLAGLAFAVGMVVDNAIVVLENVDRHLGLGKSPKQAAYDGTKEVWGAVLASTLTTLAVFIPVLTIQEEAGQLFRDIALAICAAVTLSLIISVTVIPAAGARLLRRKREQEKDGRAVTGFRNLFGLITIFERLTRGFSATIYRLTGRNVSAVLVRVALVLALTGAAIGGAMLLKPPTSYLPAGNRNLVIGMMFTPPSYSMEQNRRIGDRVEQITSPFWAFDGEVPDEDKLPVIRDREGNVVEVPPIDNFFFVVRSGSVFMGAASADPANVQGLIPLMNEAMSDKYSPGSMGFASQRSIFGRGLGGTNSIDVELSGDDLDDLRQSASSLFTALGQKYGFGTGVRKEPQNFDLPGPELQFRIDRVTAADAGVDVASLGLAIQSLVDGAVIGDYRDGDDNIDLVLIRDPDVGLMPEQVKMVPVAFRTPRGETGTLPLDSVVQIDWADAPQEINRIEERRAIKLIVQPPSEVPLEQAQRDIEAMIAPLRDSGQIAPGVEINMAGTADKLTTVRQEMIGQWQGFSWESVTSIGASRLMLSLIIVYLLMAALFESFLYPFVIMFAVPLAAAGGFMGLALVHAADPLQQLDVLTMLGFVILIGIVVNNAILIVHQALNFMRGEGLGVGDHRAGETMPHREAIREAVRTRLRPIMMTTTTSVFGMAPLVLSRFVSFGAPSSGSELYAGLGSVVIGGLAVSTVFTLVVVPLVFSLTLDAKAAIVKAFGGEIAEEAGDKAAQPNAQPAGAQPAMATASSESAKPAKPAAKSSTDTDTDLPPDADPMPAK